jgi:hypothetical protein
MANPPKGRSRHRTDARNAQQEDVEWYRLRDSGWVVWRCLSRISRLCWCFPSDSDESRAANTISGRRVVFSSCPRIDWAGLLYFQPILWCWLGLSWNSVCIASLNMKISKIYLSTKVNPIHPPGRNLPPAHLWERPCISWRKIRVAGPIICSLVHKKNNIFSSGTQIRH